MFQPETKSRKRRKREAKTKKSECLFRENKTSKCCKQLKPFRRLKPWEKKRENILKPGEFSIKTSISDPPDPQSPGVSGLSAFKELNSQRKLGPGTGFWSLCANKTQIRLGFVSD